MRRKQRARGNDFLHVAVDDHSRVAFVQVHPDEQGTTTARFLLDAAAHFAELGVKIERVMTDRHLSYMNSRVFQGGDGVHGGTSHPHSQVPPSDQRQGGAVHPDHAQGVGVQMEKRLVTRYAMQAAEAADENQRRVEGVFDELSKTKPTTVSYLVLRLEDDSFVHLSFHDHGDDEVNPIASTAAFARFQEGRADRRAGAVDQQTATLVGAYITTTG